MLTMIMQNFFQRKEGRGWDWVGLGLSLFFRRLIWFVAVLCCVGVCPKEIFRDWNLCSAAQFSLLSMLITTTTTIHFRRGLKLELDFTEFRAWETVFIFFLSILDAFYCTLNFNGNMVLIFKMRNYKQTDNLSVLIGDVNFKWKYDTLFSKALF